MTTFRSKYHHKEKRGFRELNTGLSRAHRISRDFPCLIAVGFATCLRPKDMLRKVLVLASRNGLSSIKMAPGLIIDIENRTDNVSHNYISRHNPRTTAQTPSFRWFNL